MLRRALALSLLACSFSAFSQQQNPVLITWYGPGGIALPTDADWKLEFITVYDHGSRPVIMLSNKSSDVSASFILYDNGSGRPDPSSCRDDAINPILRNEGKSIRDRKDSIATGDKALPLALTSYVSPIAGKATQHNLFAFAADARTCFEVHLSAVEQPSAPSHKLEDALKDFHPLPGYQPNAQDDFLIASLLFPKSPALAAPYYKESLNRIPDAADSLPQRRVVTDQLVMSLGMAGDLKNSRAVAEDAIKQDPDYPINYYNLACADAESGNAAAARTHLEQAFARKANVLPGEQMPDPSKDDSILKLKADPTFWAFVQTLP